MSGACSPKSLIFSQFHTLQPLFSRLSLAHCNMLFKLSNQHLIYMTMEDESEGVPSENRIPLTSKQQQRQWRQMSCALSADCVGFGVSAFDGRGRELLLFQELSGPIVKTPLSTHMLDSHSRTANII